MNKNTKMTTLFTICLLNLQLSISQNIEQQNLSSSSMHRQLDETCNLMTTNTGVNTYTFTVMPVDLTPDCTHYFKYFAYNPKTNTWYLYLTDSIATLPYHVQVGFSKNVTYRVQHYIVSNDKNCRSHVFEADFILKKNLVAKEATINILDMIAQRNIEAISNTDSGMPVYFSSNQSFQNTSKFKMQH